MQTSPATGRLQCAAALLLAAMCLTAMVSAIERTTSSQEPAVWLTFDEGSGLSTFDNSGHGNGGTLHNAARIDGGGCGRAVYLDGVNSYIDIPYRTQNHPDREITVSLWFYTDSYEPQTLLSTDYNGGYRLGFADGNDLWWTISNEGEHEIVVPVQHESITLNEWHHLAGTYDGRTARVYLDGSLRNQVNATGRIRYGSTNYVIAGAEAGPADAPPAECPLYFRGGIDEIRIYDRALSYGEVMEDRFLCPQEPGIPGQRPPAKELPLPCGNRSGMIRLGPDSSGFLTIVIPDRTTEGIWQVTVPPGSTLFVTARDKYPAAYPDAWYIELKDEYGRLDRSIAIPNTINTPISGTVPSGNATVIVRYFDGKERFPTRVVLQFDVRTPPQSPPPPKPMIFNPIIVIYSAAWATLIALVVVMVWLHRRRTRQQ